MAEKKTYFFKYLFVMENGDGISYMTNREFYEKEYTVKYAIDWLRNKSYKFGECFIVEIYEENKDNLVYSILIN